jgi:hypothetical protein
MDRDETDEWVEVRRSSDAIGADMICDFLREHEVRAAIRGNTRATRMTWSATTDLIRIVVAKADLEKAHEALAAMSAGDTHPFRGPSPPPAEGEEIEDAFVKPRSALAAAMLGLLVPMGAGHFDARHGAAGTILCAGTVGSVLGMWLTGRPELARAWAILVVLDVVGSVLAVRRFNRQQVPAENVQRRWAMGAVAIAFVVAWLSSG